MAKKGASLYKQFQPEKYVLELRPGIANLTINGKKLPPPSKRITLHQQDLKITKARIIQKAKKGTTEHEVIRINHLPTFQEVRLHTKELLYPGECEVILEYKLDAQKAAKLKAGKPSRELVPSIDETEAWAQANFELKQ